MANPSNLYAEKVYAEHPLALWSLDDQVDYLSLITNSERNLNNGWTSNLDPFKGGLVTTDLTIYNEPMPTTPVNKVLGNVENTFNAQVKFVSPEIENFATLNQSLETFSIGVNVFAANEYVTGYEIGYEYTNPLTSAVVEKVKTFSSTISNKWLFISETFDILDAPINFRIVLKLNYINVGPVPEGYKFYVNGLTLGQWSEEFSRTSPGITKTLLPSNISGMSGYGTPSQTYGLVDSRGYYVIDGNTMLAKNAGLPMVYGAEDSTVITPHPTPGKPSLILPGNGFLNNSGKYKDYTLEFWLKVDSLSTQLRRIVGPISSIGDYGDGIYVHGPFIKLKIGNNVGAHFVGDWSRPMLVDLKIGDGSAGLMINGEQVVSLSFDIESVIYPSESNENKTSPDYGKSQDWIGFYAYSDIPFIKIDCVGLYSYQVSTILAKRRFAYGQAVDFPESVNTAYGGTSVFIDYPFAEYTNNYSYPDIGKFGQGIVENLEINDGVLSTPEYKLPTIRFQDQSLTLLRWSDHGVTVEHNGLPAISKNAIATSSNYLLFEKFNILKENVKAIYGIFSTSEFSTTKQTLFRIENRTNGSYFDASLVGQEVVYTLKYGNTPIQNLYSEPGITQGSTFFAGIAIDDLVNFYGKDVAAFFGNRNQLEIYLGSEKTFTNQLNGYIYKFGFCTKRNFKKVSHLFNKTFSSILTYDAGSGYYGQDPAYWTSVIDGGVAGSFTNSEIYLHKASYTLAPKMEFGLPSLDIDVDSYWEDYLPLTYFAQYVTNSKGGKFYDLDFIQFNVGYPALDIYDGVSYDTSSSFVKTYVTFKFDAALPANYEDTYKNTVLAPKDGIVHPNSKTHIIGYTSEPSPQPIYDDFMNTRYEVVDGTIIYPPAGMDIKKLSMSTHIEMLVDGIATNPIKVKSLQYASEAFNSVTANPIGTRFGNKIYPYKKYGSYYDYKSRNPFRIYKGSTPYLYLTKNSGIEKVGPYDELVNSGLAIPINDSLATQYQAIAMQMALRYGQDSFPTTPVQIFEIESKDSYIKFFLVANDTTGKRARIYAINAKTGKFENGISFYVNGKLVRDPVLSLKSWTFLGINFSKILNFNSYVGGLRITGNILTNIVSIYKSTNLQEVQRSLLRPWYRVSQNTVEDLAWTYWDDAFTWNGVLVSASSDFSGVDPSDIYKSYTGTNKIIADDDRAFSINSYEYGIHRYLSSTSQVITAV